jgi:ribosome-binding ATPase YchF (GTP1/OBG family)
MLRICIIGPEGTGKSALFGLLSGEKPKDAMLSETFTPPLAVVSFQDARLEELLKLLPGREVKRTHYSLQDFPGFGKGTPPKLMSRILPEIRKADLALVVLKAENGAEAAKEWQAFHQELVVTDYSCSESSLTSMRTRLKSVKRAEDDPRYKLLAHVVALLDAGEGLCAKLTEEERTQLGDLALLTAKPMLLIINTGDKVVDAELHEDFAQALDGAEGITRWHALPVSLAAELAAIPESEQDEFKELYGVTEPLLPPVQGALLPTLGHISFYTYNEKELTVWTVPEGSTAVQAAGAIHTDIAKGFIRAEVFNAADVIALGSPDLIKPSGKHRTEGKEYIIRDGDILLVHFSK